ncbi:MAG: gliding motility-associated C-terminal domain-containing protein [Cyclobacteriaceae bacterium]
MKKFCWVAFWATATFASAQPNITRIEYFIDADPGRGNGISIALNNPSVSILENVPTGSLSEGFHLITVRAQDENSVWGLPESKPFFVGASSTTSSNTIEAMEYFIDADPGRGLGIAIPITPAISLNVLENMPTSTLSDGFHVLTIRARDQFGQWSLSESRPFFVSSSSTTFSSTIVAMEYFIDTDPGIGSGVAIPLTPAMSLDFIENIPTGSLTNGFHLLTLRAQDQQGNWGLTESKPFYVDNSRQIVNYEYAIDTDPGIGLATQQPIAPPQVSIDEPILIDTNPLSVGSHNLVLRVQDSNLFWSKTSIVPFNICLGGVPNFSASAVCLGNSTLFNDLSTGVLPGDIYSWDFDGDLIEDDNTAGSTSFTYLATGTYTATLTINRSGCIGQFTMDVDVVSPPTVSAGVDQLVCPGNPVSPSGAIGGGATSATWTTSGSGIFDDQTILTPTYTPSIADEANGSVTLSFTIAASATCQQVSDDMVITFAQPITAANLDIEASVQQPVLIDLIAASTINPGDEITIDILQDPTKGTVTPGTGSNTLFLANSGTVGNDSFQYRICNQCDLCSIGTISIDILNVAPVFTAPTTTPEAAPGQTIVISIPDVVSDLNDNIDLNSFSNFSSTANATFSYDANTGDLTLDYTNAAFTSAQDNISFTICDLLNSCTDVTIQIDLNGEITIFNGVSPNEDGLNDFFDIRNIQFIEPTNKVMIYNRWGDKVFEQENYNSDDPAKRFEGKRNNGTELPSGIYFYKVEFPSGRGELAGYLTLKK